LAREPSRPRTRPIRPMLRRHTAIERPDWAACLGPGRAVLVVTVFPFDATRGYATLDWPEEPDPFGRLAIKGPICREQLGDVFTPCIPR
jgi:hypothetical protein